jgi:hypothetical protein
MPALCVSADGNHIFLALEDSSTGFPVIAKAARADLATWSAAYEPGAGTAANVVATGNPDVMLFFGNFGSGVQVVKHVVSTGAETNISPAGLTTKIVNGLAVNPSNPAEIAITVDTDQDVLYTDDTGANWETWDSALGFNATAFTALWTDSDDPHRYFAAGDVSGTLELRYSPNEGASDADYAGGVGAAANVCAIEVTYVTA